MYVPNVSDKPYLITDRYRDSPVGFGVKISATKKTYIVQRLVSSPGNRPKTGGNLHRWLSGLQLAMPLI